VVADEVQLQYGEVGEEGAKLFRREDVMGKPLFGATGRVRDGTLTNTTPPGRKMRRISRAVPRTVSSSAWCITCVEITP